MTKTLSVYDNTTIHADVQMSIETKNYLPIILHFIRRDHATPQDKIYIYKHPAVTELHTAHGHIHAPVIV